MREDVFVDGGGEVIAEGLANFNAAADLAGGDIQ
jgi:hypothetical protein